MKLNFCISFKNLQMFSLDKMRQNRSRTSSNFTALQIFGHSQNFNQPLMLYLLHALLGKLGKMCKKKDIGTNYHRLFI